MSDPSTRPDTMTWSRALPVLIVSAILDFIRICFEWLGILAPIIAAGLTVAALNSSAWTSWLPGFAKDWAGLGAGALVAIAFPVLESLGIVLSMAVGFLSWLIVGGWLVMSNRRIFKANAFSFILFVAGLGADEIPFLSGFIPGLSITVWNMYRTQIKKEKVVLKKWEAENLAQLATQRAEQVEEAQAFLAARANEQAGREAEEQAARDAQDAYDELGFDGLSGVDEQLEAERAAGLYPDYSKSSGAREFA